MNMGRISTILASGGLLAAGLVGLACRDSSLSGGRRHGAVSPASRHAVRSEQLHALMETIGGRVAKDWPQEIADLRAAQAVQDEQARFQHARQVARALAQAADQIPGAIADTPLGESDRQAFLASAEELKHKAAELETFAAARDLDRMQVTLSQIKTVCYGCHAQFREQAGPLHFGHDW